MEFEELKRVRTLSKFRVNRAKICNWSRVNEVFGQIFRKFVQYLVNVASKSTQTSVVSPRA